MQFISFLKGWCTGLFSGGKLATVNFHRNIGVSKNRGTPKWMVYNGKPENPIKMDDLGVSLFLETPI